MKIIKVTQSCLKRSNFLNSRNLRYEIDPKTFLEISPKPFYPQNIQDIKERRDGSGGLFKFILPEGYPYSVHENYFKFTTWTSLQGITSSFIGGNLNFLLIFNFILFSAFNSSHARYINEHFQHYSLRSGSILV